MNLKETEAFAQRLVALGFYTQKNVSIGYCAQIAGMAEEDFIRFLGENKVSVFQFDHKDKFIEELENA